MKSHNAFGWMRNFALLAALCLLPLATAAFAQTANQANVNASRTESGVAIRDDDDDDDTDWGWVGLLGLAGLLGLLPRKREVVTRDREIHTDRR